jgi:hypothetical protein
MNGVSDNLKEQYRYVMPHRTHLRGPGKHSPGLDPTSIPHDIPEEKGDESILVSPNATPTVTPLDQKIDYSSKANKKFEETDNPQMDMDERQRAMKSFGGIGSINQLIQANREKFAVENVDMLALCNNSLVISAVNSILNNMEAIFDTPSELRDCLRAHRGAKLWRSQTDDEKYKEALKVFNDEINAVLLDTHDMSPNEKISYLIDKERNYTDPVYPIFRLLLERLRMGEEKDGKFVITKHAEQLRRSTQDRKYK